MSGIILTFCAFGLGALAVLALPPFSMPVLLPVAFGALYLLTVGESRMRAGLAGWAFGVGYFLFGLSWIAESFFVDPERLAWMAVPAVAGLAAGLALFPAAAMAAFAWSRTKGVSGALIFAVCWSVSEWLRGTMLTGFPWNLIAYTWAEYDIPRQMAAWVGSYGLGLLTVLLSVLPVMLLMRNRRQNAFAAFVFMSVVGVPEPSVRFALWPPHRQQTQPSGPFRETFFRRRNGTPRSATGTYPAIWTCPRSLAASTSFSGLKVHFPVILMRILKCWIKLPNVCLRAVFF